MDRRDSASSSSTSSSNHHRGHHDFFNHQSINDGTPSPSSSVSHASSSLMNGNSTKTSSNTSSESPKICHKSNVGLLTNNSYPNHNQSNLQKPIVFECHRMSPSPSPTNIRRCSSMRTTTSRTQQNSFGTPNFERKNSKSGLLSPSHLTSSNVGQSWTNSPSSFRRSRRRRSTFTAASSSYYSSRNQEEGSENNSSDSFENSYFRYKTPKADPLSLLNISIAMKASPNLENLHRVLVAGMTGCGKSTLIDSFSTQLEEQKATFRSRNNLGIQEGKLVKKSSFRGDNNRKLSNRIILHFRETGSLDSFTSVRESLTVYRPDAYVVAYSVSDRLSFESAKDILTQIQHFEGTEFDNKPVIIVANKTDLVRSRCISKSEGRQLAIDYGVKYIETSCTISLNVDFLLVGIGAQINLKESIRERKSSSKSSSRKPGILRRLLNRTVRLRSSRSCDNLSVL